MRNFVVLGYLLYAAMTMMLMNQQEILVEAKPFLSAKFFVLTTRAPCTSQLTTNCNSSPSASSSSTGGVQTYNLLEPKLRFLSNLLRSVMNNGGSSISGSKGGFGFTFNKFVGQRPAATTTTTSSPDAFTEPDAIFKPDSSESSNTETSTTLKTTTTITTTERIDNTKPGYSYEGNKNIVSGSISVPTNTPTGGPSTNFAIINRVGEDDLNDVKAEENLITPSTANKYEEPKKSEESTTNDVSGSISISASTPLGSASTNIAAESSDSTKTVPSISVSTNTPTGGPSTNFPILNRVGEDNLNDDKTEETSITPSAANKYEESEKSEENTTNDVSGSISVSAITPLGSASTNIAAESSEATKAVPSFESNNDNSGNISVPASAPLGSVSTNVGLSSRLGENASANDEDKETSSTISDGYKYEVSKKPEAIDLVSTVAEPSTAYLPAAPSENEVTR